MALSQFRLGSSRGLYATHEFDPCGEVSKAALVEREEHEYIARVLKGDVRRQEMDDDSSATTIIDVVLFISIGW